MTQKEFQSKIDAICSCMEQESREQMVERLYQEQVQSPQGEVGAMLAAAAKSVAENIYNFVTQNTWDGWTKEQCEQIIIKHFQPLVQRLEQAERQYNELLYAVGNKYPNETRHQTALRYISTWEGKSITGQAKDTNAP